MAGLYGEENVASICCVVVVDLRMVVKKNLKSLCCMLMRSLMCELIEKGSTFCLYKSSC